MYKISINFIPGSSSHTHTQEASVFSLSQNNLNFAKEKGSFARKEHPRVQWVRRWGQVTFVTCDSLPLECLSVGRVTFNRQEIARRQRRLKVFLTSLTPLSLFFFLSSSSSSSSLYSSFSTSPSPCVSDWILGWLSQLSPQAVITWIQSTKFLSPSLSLSPPDLS